MQKTEIQQDLVNQHKELMTFLNGLSDAEIHHQNDGKWSALQNVEHLLKSIQVVNPAVRKPSILLRSAFGKPNRPARTYEELVQRYQDKLQNGQAKAPEQYVARETVDLNRKEIIDQYDHEVGKFLNFVAKVKDRKLDRTLLPHPLLGKILMREVLYFMHYHTEHHFTAIKKSVE